VGSHNSYELLCLLPTVIRPIAVHTYMSELFITVVDVLYHSTLSSRSASSISFLTSNVSLIAIKKRSILPKIVYILSVIASRVILSI
jgi:hypothetical protein